MGLSQQLVGKLGQLLRSAYTTITTCPCDRGCLECVLLPTCYEDGLDKDAGKIILRALLGDVDDKAHESIKI